MRALAMCFASLSLAANAQQPGPASSTLVLVHNGSDVADAVDSVTIAVSICDAAGRPLANVPVRIEVSGSRNWITPAAAGLTDANGLLIANLTSTAAETKTITVVANPGPDGFVLHDRPSVTFRAGPPARFEIVPGGSAVLAWDFFGNFAGVLALDESDQEQ